MTVIAAMRESEDAILLAADSGGWEEPGGRIHVADKLQAHATAPIAWASAGNTTVGSDFDKWLKAYDWPPADWTTFRDEAIESLSRLNGRQRELVALPAV